MAPIWDIFNLGIGGRLDTQPVELAAELAHRLQGRSCYSIARTPAGLHAELRTAASITRPRPQQVVVPVHDCRQPLTHPNQHPDYFNLNPAPVPDMMEPPF